MHPRTFPFIAMNKVALNKPFSLKRKKKHTQYIYAHTHDFEQAIFFKNRHFIHSFHEFIAIHSFYELAMNKKAVNKPSLLT